RALTQLLCISDVETLAPPVADRVHLGENGKQPKQRRGVAWRQRIHLGRRQCFQVLAEAVDEVVQRLEWNRFVFMTPARQRDDVRGGARQPFSKRSEQGALADS